MLNLIYCCILQKEERLEEIPSASENDSSTYNLRTRKVSKEVDITAAPKVTNKKLKKKKKKKIRKTKWLTCDICNKTVVSRNLFRHIRHVHGDKYYYCEHCEHKTKVKDALRSHINARHIVLWDTRHTNSRQRVTKIETIECDICSKKFKSIGLLNKHSNIHSETRKTYSCTICNKKFLGRTNWSVHMQVKHSTDLKHEICNICDKTFICKRYLMKHISRTHCNHISKNHSKPASFQCHCGESFAHVAQFRIHSFKHEKLRKFKCTKCEMRFKKQNNLNRHLQSVHSDARPFPCNLCNKTFKLKHVLHKHIQDIHSDTTRQWCLAI